MNAKQIRARLEPYLVAELPNGEWDARCPLHEDKKRSARFNFEKSLWKCFAGCGSGRLSGLIRRMDGEAVRREGSRTSGHGREQSDRVKSAAAWHRALLGDADVQDYLYAKRAINRSTIEARNLGWDQARQAFTIPIYDEEKHLINVRMYRPDAPSDRKIWWAWKKEKGEQIPLYPYDVLTSSWVVIAEGEMDALIANQNGIPAITGTAGAGTWKREWSSAFEDKKVYIMYDRDDAGAKGALEVAQALESFADRIWIATVNIRKQGADISDFFDRGNDRDDFIEMLRKRRKEHEKRVSNPTKMRPRRTSVLDSFDGANVGRHIQMDVLVSARGSTPHTVPREVSVDCKINADPKMCAVCPMADHNGHMQLDIERWRKEVLAFQLGGEQQDRDNIRKLIGIPRCPMFTYDIRRHQTIESLRIRPSFDSEEILTNRTIYSVGKHDTQPSQVVTVSGTTWPNPKTSENEFLAWSVDEAESAIDEFDVTTDVIKTLSKFRTPESITPLRKLNTIARDIEQHVTRIYGRREMHMAMLLVYCSMLGFRFRGVDETKGWLDALIIGDTRTGKSEAAKQLVDFLRLGTLINCEVASRSGIIGGVERIGANREWAVEWGAIPMNDRRMVILDEVSSLTHGQIQDMSDVRSSGIANVIKIVKGQARARTRLMMLSNPRDASMKEFTWGAQAIKPLIGNQEDIARFEFAMALKGTDVSRETIQQKPATSKARFSDDDLHQLILWAWSRQPDEVVWRSRAEDEVMKVATDLGERYGLIDPPLVQSANIHHKVARIAAALAACVFSSDRTGKRVIVRPEHVQGAATFLNGIYKHASFGFKDMADIQTSTRRASIEMLPEAEVWLKENPMLIRLLKDLKESEFQVATLQNYLHLSPDMVGAYVNQMFKFGLVTTNSGGVRLTENMHQLLREL